MRIPIYPAVEEFIQSKKQNKYANLQKQTSNTDTSKKTTVKRGIKRKDTVEEKREKSAAKRSRAAASSSTSVLLCGSCNAEGHSSARSKLCLNYKFTLKDLIQRDIGGKHERYTISIPLKSFLNETNDNEQLGKAVKDEIQAFINPLIVELKNRVPSLTTTKATLNTNPFGILPAIRHILSKYESLIAENPKPQTHGLQLESSEDVSQSSSKTKEKGKGKCKSEDEQRFVPPRLFSMFPNPGLQWRFIKIDGQNITGIFPGASLKKEANETLFCYTQNAGLEDLQNLAVEKGKMFLNGLYTDGYTCRVLFCRKVRPLSPIENVSLELEDFSAEEVDKHFRPCTVDPGRKDVFVSYHRSNDLRRLSTKEYYNMGGTIRRQRKEQELKRSLGIEEIESNIPTPKTTSCEQYISYIKYIFQHMNVLFDFYSFRTAAIKWRNYVGSQKRIQDAVNILLNGSKKYNKDKERNRSSKEV
ncbi:hypothetical protein K501DRAFT_274642 [Backusella circina FSU 941]|nr:hypothetical protein K501DRAFT_274642 [Backusella circina FSU 941]